MSISFHRQESPTINHTQGLVTFVGTLVCALGLVTGEGFVQADYVELGTSRMKAAITYSADGFSGFLRAVANLDQTVWTIAEWEQREKPGVDSLGQFPMLVTCR